MKNLCLAAGALTSAAAFSGCSGDEVSTTSKAKSCDKISGSTWEPEVSGMSIANHDSNALVETSELSATGQLTGLTDNFNLINVTFSVSEDLGVGGSISLVAETTNFPSQLEGGAYPVLVSLKDSSGKEFVNLNDSGVAPSWCTDTGLYCCDSVGCDPNTKWQIDSPSAFPDRDLWEQHQIIDFYRFTSVNTFPTCDWTETISGTASCVFSDGTFPGSAGAYKLRTGTYTAQYALVLGLYADNPGLTAGVKVTVVKKKDDDKDAGALDVNLILVGDRNIEDSRTDAGKRNLNALFQHFYDHYAQANTNIRIGNINVIEWGCDEDGDEFATVDYEELGEMFSSAASVIPSDTDARAVNVFFVSTISAGDTGSTILGISGGIGGPMINGTDSSGIVVATFNGLADFNPSCTTDCPVASQEAQFVDMGATISHEVGHFLGLNHPSESGGDLHDGVPDSPRCTATESFGTADYITIRSCYRDDVNTLGAPFSTSTCKIACGVSYDGTTVFCPAVTECQFNHVMWWTSKNFSNGQGDGNLFSTQSSAILNFNPYVQ